MGLCRPPRFLPLATITATLSLDWVARQFGRAFTMTGNALTLLELYLPLALAGASLHGSPDATRQPTSTAIMASPAATETVGASETPEPTATEPSPTRAATEPRPTATRVTPTGTPTRIAHASLHARSWTSDDGRHMLAHTVWQNTFPYPVYLFQPDEEVVSLAGAVLRRTDNSRRAGIPLQPGAFYCMVQDERPEDLPAEAALVRLADGGVARVQPVAPDLVPRYMAMPAVQIQRDEIERDGQDYHHRLRLLRLDTGTGQVTATSIHQDTRGAFLFCTVGQVALLPATPKDVTLTTIVDLRYSRERTTTFR